MSPSSTARESTKDPSSDHLSDCVPLMRSVRIGSELNPNPAPKSARARANSSCALPVNAGSVSSAGVDAERSCVAVRRGEPL